MRRFFIVSNTTQFYKDYKKYNQTIKTKDSSTKITKPNISDYFKSIQHQIVTYQVFFHKEKLYLMLDCDTLTTKDNVDGFIDISKNEYTECLHKIN